MRFEINTSPSENETSTISRYRERNLNFITRPRMKKCRKTQFRNQSCRDYHFFSQCCGPDRAVSWRRWRRGWGSLPPAWKNSSKSEIIRALNEIFWYLFLEITIILYMSKKVENFSEDFLFFKNTLYIWKYLFRTFG